MKQNEKMVELDIDTLGHYLDRALNVLIKRLNSVFKERGIDLQHAQFIILKVLYCRDGLSQRELAFQLGKDPAAVCRAVKYLENKGYVEQRPVNGTTNHVFLTERAKEIRPDIDGIADEITSLGLNGLDDEQIKNGIIFLTHIYHSAKP
ncbi:MAG: winged helix-turn-helix transcriptional regulator [Bacteroides sp.]|nr:winged helix-turn-helix transcriptional regulator [Bacteroides sp.]